MREIISLSMGSNANFKATHHWNGQDEQLKLLPTEGEEAKGAAAQLSVQYHELTSTAQLVPRHVFVDFGENYGNTMSCFGSQSPHKSLEPSSQLTSIESQLWAGPVED